ncbi:helix-turn-helix transcriptional regulator [Catenulispora rubra]|uniref:helix-turn-helix transcriptional regulator n=1 Tax=Catenulispora rubra TaxID=280293 RepID=UPI0018922C5D|nr:helix-turn-helix transcriptional regulator [Catenulispora rubra]
MNGPDLAARLHAAVDAVLGRYDCEHAPARDDLAILNYMSEVEESFLNGPPESGQLLQIQRAPGESPKTPDTSLPTADLLTNGHLAPARSRQRPEIEVRTLPGLTTWLAVIDSAAVVLPKRHDRAGRERTVSRSPAVLAVATWAFHHADPAPSPRGPAAHLSQLEVRILRCLSAGLKDEQAARRLEISVRTYRRRVTALCDQLHASSRFEAGVAAAKRGLV